MVYVFKGGQGNIMKVMTTKEEVRSQIREWRSKGLTIGLCPTMGSLHDGHLSLMRASKSENDKTVVSVFINPIQFGPSEDLDTYPKNFERDCELMAEVGVDLVFHPDPAEMYGEDFCTFVDMDRLTGTLCGQSRPVMFRGVCTVLTKLMHIIAPDKMYMGKKDAQQLAVVKRLAIDLDFDTQIIGCPTIREDDGLAKSSRNTYLSPDQRADAGIIPASLRLAQQLITGGERNSQIIRTQITDLLLTKPVRIDYVEIVDGMTMQPVDEIKKGDLVAIAVFIGDTRLIDNFTVGDSDI